MGLTAIQQAKQILLIVSYVLNRQESHGVVTVDEVCARFSISEADLAKDLQLVNLDVGVSPFTPDKMIETGIDDGYIDIRLGDYYLNPLHMTSRDGMLLLTVGQSVLADGSDEERATLESAVQKLEVALNIGSDELEVALEMGAQHVLAVVREAAISDEVIEIRYHSFGKDEVAVRSIDPYSLHARDGHWYLLARCHQADALRHFRLDRILEASATGEFFVRPDTEPAFEFELPSDMRKVLLDVPASSSWVTDTYPTVSAETQANGRLLIEIESGSSAFLERLLLRLGADASATDSLSGESVLPVRAAAAKRILARYED